MTLQQLAERIGGAVDRDPQRVVVGCAPLESAGPTEVAFLANRKYERQMPGTKAAAVIVSRDYAGPGPALIRCKDSYFAFREAMVAFYGFRQAEFDGVDERANVHPTARLGEGARVAALATVGPEVEVGAGTVIYPGAYVGPRCRIGAECILHPNVTLYDGTVLGDRVTLHAGTSIGQDGFGYATHGGAHHKIPQVGRVVVEDDVEMGAGCAIDRASMGETVIGRGTKMSNLVTVAHATKIGKHCLMVAQVGVAGSVTVGDYCVFAGQVGVVGHIRIGDGVKVAAQSGVTNDIPAGAEVLGSPAIPLAEARRSLISMSRLPEIRTTVRKLTRELRHLKEIWPGGRGGGDDDDGAAEDRQ